MMFSSALTGINHIDVAVTGCATYSSMPRSKQCTGNTTLLCDDMVDKADINDVRSQRSPTWRGTIVAQSQILNESAHFLFPIELALCA
eukprot:scaffold197823_cov24-Prasinocladus_malaysianus.AAC.1